MSTTAVTTSSSGWTALPMNAAIAWRGPGLQGVVPGSGASVATTSSSAGAAGSGFVVDVLA